MIKLYPSSAGFADTNGIVFTQYESACPRAALLQHAGVRASSIDPESQKIGVLFEDLVETMELNLGTHVKEYPFKSNIGETVISGRVDFLKDGTVHECKATFSSSTAREIIDQGKIKVNHLAQIAAYFVALRPKYVILHVGRFQKSDEGYICTKQRAFKIEVGTEGEIIVDGTPTSYTIPGYIRWVRVVSKAITQKDFGTPRPVNLERAWSSPCHYCPYAEVCDRVDQGKVSDYESFVSECKSKAEAVVVRPAKITKARKGKA